MTEARALNVFNSCKESPIPVYVRLLTCFMSAIKNRTLKGQGKDRDGKEKEGKSDVFVALANTNALNWTDHEVADAIKKLLKQSGPIAFKGPSKPAQRYYQQSWDSLLNPAQFAEQRGRSIWVGNAETGHLASALLSGTDCSLRLGPLCEA